MLSEEKATFREIRREDVGDVVILIRSTFDEVISKQTTPTIAAYLRDRRTSSYVEQYFGKIGNFFVLTYEDKIVGTIALMYPRYAGHREFSEDLPELRSLYVLPTERGKEYGRSLVENLGKYAASVGFKGLIVSSGPATEKFYEKMGFKKVGVETYKYPTKPEKPAEFEELTCPIMINKFKL